MEDYPVIKEKDGKKVFFRFSLEDRVQHIILALSVIILVLTGMPLKFHDAPWASFIYDLFGGIKGAPIVHKIAGSALLLVFFYHVITLFKNIGRHYIAPLRREGKTGVVDFLKMLANLPLIPNKKDLFDIIDLMKYLLFISNKRPDGARFTWKEKFDYWAPFWGIFIIGITGLIMWNKEIASTFISGVVINFCLIAHSDEALLAALFLFIWHWYNVHFSLSVFPMGTVFLTGYLSEELMVEEHYEHYVEVMKEDGRDSEILPPHGAHDHNEPEGGQA